MNKDPHEQHGKVTRRGFLKVGGAGAGAAAVAAVLPVAAADAVPAGEPKRPSAGYRETEHVRRVYELSRF